MSIQQRLLLIGILGTVVRIIYAFLFEPWNLAPDQLSWELLLKEEGFSYAQLIHYPHEGGSILLSLLAKFTLLFSDFHPLTIVALIVDTFSRIIQLFIAYKLFGKKLAYLLGFWTILVIPSILPWSSVNYGLHSLSSFFPFVFTWLILKVNTSTKDHLWLCLFIGFSIWFYYTNAIFLIIYFVFLIVKRPAFKTFLPGILSLGVIFLLHTAVRTYADSGFHLNTFDSSSIRGVSFGFDQINNISNLYNLWFGPVAQSFVSGIQSEFLLLYVEYFLVGILLIGLILCAYRFIKNKAQNVYILPFLIIPLFLLIYAFSPFYHEVDAAGHYIGYRHLTYIFPFLVLFCLYGLQFFKLSQFAIPLFLFLSIYVSSLSFLNKKYDVEISNVTGWVLGKKMGHDTPKLRSIVEQFDGDKKQLLRGISWGITSALFEEIKDEKDPLVLKNVRKLYSILNAYPEAEKCNLIGGVVFGLGHKVTPRVKGSVARKVLIREDLMYLSSL